MSLENNNEFADAVENENDSTEIIQQEIELEQAFVPANLADLLAHATNLQVEVTDITQLYHKLKKLKPFLDEFLESEKSFALDKFIAEGGEIDDFEFKPAPETAQLELHFKQTREKFTKQQAQLVAQKDTNLKVKQDILHKMRVLLDSEEDNLSNSKFKTLTLNPKPPNPKR